MIGVANWKLTSNEHKIHELAENQARAHFAKDKAFRLWLTGHGRIYIPVGEKYQPDPYLAHIKDRDVITDSGIKLSMINPARIVRELDQQYGDFYGVGGRVTSLMPIRPENAPDAWEKTALQKIEQGVQEVFEYTDIDGEPYLRLIQPLPITSGCLLCHEYLAEKTNNVGGGVTVALPMKSFLLQQKVENRKDIQLLSMIWLIGVIGLGIAYIILRKQVFEKRAAFVSLESSQSRNRSIMESALDSIITIDEAGVITEVNPATEKTFGFVRDDMIGQDLAELIIPPKMREQHRAGLKRLVDTGESSILNTRIETTAMHTDGHLFPVELAITRIDEEGDGSFFTAYLRDLTEANELKEELTYQAGHDVLTGLLNRRAFEEHVQHVLEDVGESTCHSLLFLDLDQFKVINDSSGHLAGDELLRQLGDLLKNNKRTIDALARVGGDEFAILLESCELQKAKELADGIVKEISSFRFYWENKVYSVGVSIGIVPIQGHSISYSELLSDADAACYRAKKEGRNRYHVFMHDDEELAQRRQEISWISRIQHALEQNRFVLYHQIIEPINTHNSDLKPHCEILLRLKDEQGNIIGPNQFIPAAESYNLMQSVDKWVVDKTFRWLSEYRNKLQSVSIYTINLSGFSITDSTFVSYVHDKLHEYSIPPEIICFEITETVVISNLAKATLFLDQLHEVGCQFALDDFGSGVSSFGYLKKLSVDYLKIDGQFVKDMAADPVNHAMVKSINEIGKVMGKTTIAEYVEDQRTVDLLKEIGVDYAQGYVFSRPSPLNDR